MTEVSYVQVPDPTWGYPIGVVILQDDEDKFYARTSYPLENDTVGPFDTTTDVREHLWGVYGRPLQPDQEM